MVQDSEYELDPDSAELFEEKASVLAVEISFLPDGFVKEAADMWFGVRVSIDMSARYGAATR